MIFEQERKWIEALGNIDILRRACGQRTDADQQPWGSALTCVRDSREAHVTGTVGQARVTGADVTASQGWGHVAPDRSV